MNPVSTRGRSVPRDRRMFRDLFVSLGILGSFLSAGCVRSPMLRPADGPDPRPAASTEVAPGNPSAAPAGPGPQVAADSRDTAVATPSAPVAPSPAASPAPAPLELQGAPTPLQVQAVELPSTPPQSQPASSPPEPQSAPAPGGDATPLLDAAIERVTAIRQQQRESTDPESFPGEPDQISSTPVVPGPSVAAATSPAVKKPQPMPPAHIDESDPPVAPTLIEEDDILPRPSRPPGPNEEIPRAVAEPLSTPGTTPRPGSAEQPKEKPEAPAPPATGDTRSTVSPTANPDALGIGTLRLCRKVHGFGSFDPLGGSGLKAGQRMLVYCEMTGMQYEAKDASFVSRLSSKIEIISAGNGAVQWTRELGPAEDVCGSRRHDFYVNYRVDLPKGLSPGSYRLCLTQTDLIAHRTTSAELPFEIVP